MPRHLVCLTFDFDAVSVPIALGATTPTPISRGEFGTVGAERLLALAAQEEIPTTWFIPGHTIETYPEICRRVVAAGHEVGHHGWRHVPPAGLGRDAEEQELRRANDAIARLSGQPARGYRSPSWDLSPHTIDLLLAHGFVYDSSMMGHDCLPYFARTGDVIAPDAPMRFGEETPLIEMPISWSLDDFPHFEFFHVGGYAVEGLKPASGVLENWLGDFDYMARHAEWGVLTYTCHPFVSGRGHRMLMLERLIAELKARGAVFVTMEQAAAEWRQMQKPKENS
jgi:peptidoglycan/xylan/chitin deacetylase (PgdA/CDA1 family)